VLICFALIAIQRVPPPERVWLFLFPMFLTWLIIGLNRILDLLFSLNKFKSIQKAILPIASMAIMVLSLPSAMHNLSTYYQYGPGTLRDAEQMAKDLIPVLQSDDRVLTVATAAPLEYYFKRHNIPIRHLRTPVAKATRIILVVMESKYSLDEVLILARIPKSQFSSPQMWQRYKSAAFYTLTRQQPPQNTPEKSS